MKKTLFILSILLLFIFGNSLLLEKNAVGAIIDFETVPITVPPDPIEQGPYDKQAITDQYWTSDGVKFSLDSPTNPAIEQMGVVDSFQGFWNDLKGEADIEADGFVGNLGDYYLRFRTFPLEDDPPSLLLEFENPVYEVWGEIWDIDATAAIEGYEQWKVSAFDSIQNPLSPTMLSPEGLDAMTNPLSLDGKPWEFYLASGNGDISYIEIEWVGTKVSGIGLAVDNIEFNAVPIPGAIWLFGSGILGMVFIRRKLKN